MKYGSLRTYARVLFLCALFAFSAFTHLHAYASGGLAITEVMYDPPGTDDKREWVEVCNQTTSDIDMHGYTFLTDGRGSTKHSLTPEQASSVVPSGMCAVIVQDPTGFRGDYPNYTGLMFDSSWTGLTSTAGKYLLILDDQSNILDERIYDPRIGGNNTGDSLQKNSYGAWYEARPSPGVPNDEGALSVLRDGGSGATTGNDTTSSSSSDTTSSSTSTSSTSTVNSSSDTSTSAATSNTLGGSSPSSAGFTVGDPRSMAPHGTLSAPTRSFAGIPVTITNAMYGSLNAPLVFGASHFALGDGSSYDGMARNSFQHVYKYPGTYVVTLEYRQNPSLPNPDVSLRLTIEVSAPSVSIATVMDDGSIVLLNSGMKEADISHWVLAPGGQLSAASFYIPPGTIVLPANKVIFTPVTTGFSLSSAKTAALLLPSGIPAATAPIPPVLVNNTVKNQTIAKQVPLPVAVTKKAPKAPVTPKKKTTKTKKVAFAGNILSANVAGAFAEAASTSTDDNHTLIILIICVLGMAVAGLWAYKKIRTSKKAFEALPAYPDKYDSEEYFRESSADVRILNE